MTIISENSVCEKKYGGIIEVCKPTVKVDKVDVTATCIDTDKLMTITAGSTDDKTIQVMSDIDSIIKNSKGVIIVCFNMYDEEISECTLKLLALLHQSLGSKFWSHVVIALRKADQYIVDGREVLAEAVEQRIKRLKEISLLQLTKPNQNA